MRDLMRIVETPISDIELRGDPDDQTTFDQGTSFGKIDKAILQSEKGRAKIVRAFKNTPHVFEVVFINIADGIDGDGEYDNDRVDNLAQVHSGVFHESKWGVDPKPGVIRVALLSNLSPLEIKKPIGGWTLAHKIGHTFQDQAMNQRGGDAILIPIIDEINKLIFMLAHPNEPHPRWVSFGYAQPHRLVSRLTMGSARKKQLDNDFEVFAEIIAQYLIAGRVKLQNLPKGFHTIEEELNALIDKLFRACEGCVMVEV